MKKEQEIVELRKEIRDALEETSDNEYYCFYCEMMIFEERNLKDGEWEMDDEGLMYGADPFHDDIPIELVEHAADCPFYERQLALGLIGKHEEEQIAGQASSPAPTLHVLSEGGYSEYNVLGIYDHVPGRDFAADVKEIPDRIKRRRDEIVAERYKPNPSATRREERRERRRKHEIERQAEAEATKEVLAELGTVYEDSAPRYWCELTGHIVDYLAKLGYKERSYDEANICAK